MTDEKKRILDELRRLGYVYFGTECNLLESVPRRWRAWATGLSSGGMTPSDEVFARCEIDALRKLSDAVSNS